MKLIKDVSFDQSADLKVIAAISSGKVSPLAAHRQPGPADFVRVYFLATNNTPIAIFDNVPYDLYIQVMTARNIPFDDGTDPGVVKLAAFEEKDCVLVDMITVPSVIWAALLLAPHCVTDLSFFREYGPRTCGLLFGKELPGEGPRS